MSAYGGTVYLASNWIAVGLTKGYARDRPEWGCATVQVPYGHGQLQALRSLLEEVGDHRSVRGLRHPLGAVLRLLVLAKLAGKSGGRQVEAFSKAWPQKELKALGCRLDWYRKRYVAPSDTTFQRALSRLEPGALERAAGGHYETVTLVEQHGADYLLEIKGNCAQTHPTLQGLDWQGARSYSHKWQRAHGRWEWRQLEVVELEAEQVPFRHAQQALRVTHRTRQTRDG